MGFGAAVDHAVDPSAQTAFPQTIFSFHVLYALLPTPFCPHHVILPTLIPAYTCSCIQYMQVSIHEEERGIFLFLNFGHLA